MEKTLLRFRPQWGLFLYVLLFLYSSFFRWVSKYTSGIFNFLKR